jgi:peptidoglycan/xylan/chitin deacetylase (PgdA/CDA1 family)
MKALLLNYHLIDGQLHAMDDFARIYAVELAEFEKQMQLLKDEQIYVATLDDIVDQKLSVDFCVGLTFDDGNPSDYSLVYPILQKHGFPATFFISKFHFDRHELNWQDYETMLRNGHSLGAHGIHHVDLTTLDKKALTDELTASKNLLLEKLQYPTRFFSLPFGMYNPQVVEAAKAAGFDALFSTQFELHPVSSHHFVIGRWSMKRNTSLKTFKAVLRRRHGLLLRYQLKAKIKSALMSTLGSGLINKINIAKNTLFKKV